MSTEDSGTGPSVSVLRLVHTKILDPRLLETGWVGKTWKHLGTGHYGRDGKGSQQYSCCHSLYSQHFRRVFDFTLNTMYTCFHSYLESRGMAILSLES